MYHNFAQLPVRLAYIRSNATKLHSMKSDPVHACKIDKKTGTHQVFSLEPAALATRLGNT